MLGWSLNLFRIRGIQLAVHSSFFLLLAYVGWLGWHPDPELNLPGGWTGVAWSIALVVAFFGCVVLHELGHSFTAMRFGIGVRRILLMPIGGMAEFDAIPRQPRRELLVTLAGPLVNFVLAIGLWFVTRDLPDATPAASIGGFAIELAAANLVMGCFNLIPVFPMDGGRILRAALASRLPYLRATAIAAFVGKLLAVAGVAAALLAPRIHIGGEPLAKGPAYLLAALFAFIFVAGELEYRATARRERDDAHMREVLARIYGARPASDRPPLLSP